MADQAQRSVSFFVYMIYLCMTVVSVAELSVEICRSLKTAFTDESIVRDKKIVNTLVKVINSNK